MDYFIVYLWTCLDDIKTLLLVIMLLCGGIALFRVLFILIHNHSIDMGEACRGAVPIKFKLKSYIPLFVICFLAIVVPSQKSVLFIYFIPQVANSEAWKDSVDLMNKLPKVIRVELQKYLDEEDSKETKK